MNKSGYIINLLLYNFLFFTPHISADTLCGAQINCPLDYYRDTISLFIIIDHSSSMSVMDPRSQRFKAACDLIDSVAEKMPTSEIGIAVFSNKLLFHYDDDSVFKQLSNTQEWNDSYFPLIRLNTQVGGVNAAEKLKWALQVDSTQIDAGNNYQLVNGNYTTSGRNSYTGTTDISLAFEAAGEAFQTAINNKNNQYIVLFMDGIAQNVDSEREQYLNDYIAGTNVPTTLTAFFVNPGQPMPNEIKEMTTNIKNNGFSSSNIKSEVVRIEGNVNDFIAKVLKTISSDPQVTFKLESCIFFDNNADGHLDSISIKMNGNNCEEYIDKIVNNLILPAHRDLVVADYTSAYSTIALIVTENSPAILTSITDKDFIEVSDTVILAENTFLLPSKSAVIDSMAPVIIKATLIDSQTISQKDQLTVEFSEPVEAIKESTPFSFYATGPSIVYEAALSVISQLDSVVSFTVDSLVGVDSIFAGDSIRINWKYTSNVFDAVGNNQDNPKNIQREVRIVTTPITTNTPLPGKFIFSVLPSVSGRQILRFSNLPSAGTVNLFTLNGRKYLEHHLRKGTSSLFLPGKHSSGIYFMHLKYGNRIVKKKFIFQE